jgi:hypothetical protein
MIKNYQYLQVESIWTHRTLQQLQRSCPIDGKQRQPQKNCWIAISPVSFYFHRYFVQAHPHILRSRNCSFLQGVHGLLLRSFLHLRAGKSRCLHIPLATGLQRHCWNLYRHFRNLKGLSSATAVADRRSHPWNPIVNIEVNIVIAVGKAAFHNYRFEE